MWSKVYTQNNRVLTIREEGGTLRKRLISKVNENYVDFIVVSEESQPPFDLIFEFAHHLGSFSAASPDAVRNSWLPEEDTPYFKIEFLTQEEVELIKKLLRNCDDDNAEKLMTKLRSNIRLQGSLSKENFIK